MGAFTLAVVLRLALANHRSSEPAGGRPWRQAVLTTLWLATGLLAVTRLASLP